MVVSFTFGRFVSRPAYRQVPARYGPPAQGCEGRKPHLGRGLCDGDDRRSGESGAYPATAHRGLLIVGCEGSRMEIRRPVVALLGAILFLSLSPGCGEVTDPLPDGQTHILKQGFRNTNPAFAEPGLWDRLLFIPSRTWVTTVHPRTVNLPLVANDGSTLKNNRSDATVTWVGHSTVLIQLDGLNILTDPQWSDRASPVTFAGPKRLMPAGVAFEN